jgi:hypothetical protein
MKHSYLKALFAKTTLFALLLSGYSHAQDTYTVESIPYQIYASDMPVQYTADDMYSDAISLPFDFRFFGNIYSQFVVGTNGQIGFDMFNANTPSGWQFDETIPNPDFPYVNGILGCLHDMNAQEEDATDATITWSVTGDAPYRRYVLMYSNQPQYSCGNDAKSTFQVVLYENFNFIDVQITKKQLCTAWNGGNALVGIVNATGEIGFAAPGRNTGAWEVVIPEGWRFRPVAEYPAYSYIKCDTDTDGIETFDLTVVQADLDPSAVFYLTPEDAELAINPITSLQYTNTTPFGPSTVYAAYNSLVVPVVLTMVDCSLGFDNDTVASASEDINADGNLANDDTDSDGLPDFLDNDDDGDQVLTSEEYVFVVGPPNGLDGDGQLDTDGDSIPNYLDNDDDGDGILTINEDTNHNGDVTDDDTNSNGIADYLENQTTAGTGENTLKNDILLYPNPVSDLLMIANTTGREISDISIYAINGVRVKQFATAGTLSVADLQSGIYLVKIQVDNQVINYKLIKK